MNSDVFVVRTDARYPAVPYGGDDRLFAALQSLFVMWGLDPRDPFGGWLKTGDRVVIKPNWVHHTNPREEGLDALVTHSQIIAYLLDLLAVALDGHGSIIIGDAPLQSCDFEELVRRTGIGGVVDRARSSYPGLEIAIEDWRLTLLDDGDAAQTRRATDALIAKNYTLVDLGAASFLEDVSDYADRFRVTCYAADLMAPHHQKGRHEYLVIRRVFDADLVINLPKMKTHIKAGLTGALKNLVGINGHKEYLPHHIRGASEDGGDCYDKRHPLREWYDAAYDRYWGTYGTLSARQRRLGARLLGGMWRASRLLTHDSTSAGSWYGNETVWRMTLDLNHLLYFGSHPPRRIITIVDGIVAGEGEGPLQPTSKRAGVLVGGSNPAYVDCVLARLMGYNISRLPTPYNAVYHRRSQFGGPHLEDVQVRLWQDGAATSVPLADLPNLDFVKPQHWRRAATLSPGGQWSRSDFHDAQQPA
jgi:uncharacterized protein (DUF362 family)